jgi:division protein CdvB (Snf7/Vps24/ESCRT-III family)
MSKKFASCIAGLKDRLSVQVSSTIETVVTSLVDHAVLSIEKQVGEAMSSVTDEITGAVSDIDAAFRDREDTCTDGEGEVEKQIEAPVIAGQQPLIPTLVLKSATGG